MKCPYCKIHYMDDERTCPICGRPNPSRRLVQAAVPVKKSRRRGPQAPKAQTAARTTAAPARTTAMPAGGRKQKQPSNLRVGLIVFGIVFLFCLLPSLIGLFFSYLPL